MKNYSDDGRQYHVGLKEGDIGKYVILPGDPKRCEKIAQYFTSSSIAIAADGPPIPVEVTLTFSPST